jgi:hypothetical protein
MTACRLGAAGACRRAKQRRTQNLQQPVALAALRKLNFANAGGILPRRTADDAASVQYVADYLAPADGLQLAQAFMQIPNAKLRRSIVNLVEQLANSEDH